VGYSGGVTATTISPFFDADIDGVACDLLTVDNSATINVAGNTLDTTLVRCESGFYSEAGENQTAVCMGTASGVSEWQYNPCLYALQVDITVEGMTVDSFNAFAAVIKAALEPSFPEASSITLQLVEEEHDDHDHKEEEEASLVLRVLCLYEDQAFRNSDFRQVQSTAFQAELQTAFESSGATVTDVAPEKPNTVLSAGVLAMPALISVIAAALVAFAGV
jgi:predicted component of type VI protein secretion system